MILDFENNYFFKYQNLYFFLNSVWRNGGGEVCDPANGLSKTLKVPFNIRHKDIRLFVRPSVLRDAHATPPGFRNRLDGLESSGRRLISLNGKVRE